MIMDQGMALQSESTVAADSLAMFSTANATRCEGLDSLVGRFAATPLTAVGEKTDQPHS